MSLFTTYIILGKICDDKIVNRRTVINIRSNISVLFLATYATANNSYPPCRYNCPDTEKLVCAALNGENRTFANRCQLELFNCTMRTSE